MNLFIEKTAAKKHSNILLRIVHNIYKVKLKLRYFNILIFGMKCINVKLCKILRFIKKISANDLT